MKTKSKLMYGLLFLVILHILGVLIAAVSDPAPKQSVNASKPASN